MVTLTPEQITDLRELQQISAELKADLVIIGAIAFQYNFPKDDRQTADIDSAVTLDLDDFAHLERRLDAAGWTRTPNLEHRWRSARGTLVDLLPAGSDLRKAKQVTWPKSECTMSLIGFEHVFSSAHPVELADKLIMPVIPAPVLMLLKIVAFMDDPNRRKKDIVDIRHILKLYEADSDRIYEDVVSEAALPDVDFASAFLCGLDLRSLCTLDELAIIHRFLAFVGDETKPAWQAFVKATPHLPEREETARAELAALVRGLNTAGGPGEIKKRPTTPQRSLFERLTLLAREGAIVRVGPLVPQPREEEFRITAIDADKDALVTVKVGSQGKPVYLPLSQIDAILHTDPGQRDLIHLKGRLQWMTLIDHWEVRPEKPDSNRGIAKRSGMRDPRAAEVRRQLEARGYRVFWTHENTANTRFGEEREIIYDQDGCYFLDRSQSFAQILVRSNSHS